MNTSLENKCKSFIANRDMIKSTFAWESSYVYPICASIFTEKNIMATGDVLKQCRTLLRSRTGVLSNFRGTVEQAAVAMLATSSHPQAKLENALKVYAALKGHFFSSSYLVLAALVIADLAESTQYGEIADRTRRIYEMMKEKHPFLTSGEDSVFAALMALSSLSDEQLMQDTERCYQLLNGQFFSSNAIQSLTHVLALGEGTPEAKCKRTTTLFQALKAKGHKYGTGYELATLGVLALLPEETEILADKIIEADAFLAQQKGYGFFGLDSKQKLMHAGMLVSMEYVNNTGVNAMNPAAIGGTISLVVAQQVALCTAIAAANAANNASN